METVPTTQTAVDANFDRKKILEEVVSYTQKRDILKNECQQLETVIATIKKDIELNTDLSSDTRNHDLIVSSKLKKDRDVLSEKIEILEKIINEFDVKVVEKKTILTRLQEEEIKYSENLEKIKIEVTTYTQNLNLVKSEYDKTKESLTSHLDSLRKEVFDHQTTLKKIIYDENQKKSWILSEEKRIARKSSDLAIYEGRTRKRARLAGVEIPEDL